MVQQEGAQSIIICNLLCNRYLLLLLFKRTYAIFMWKKHGEGELNVNVYSFSIFKNFYGSKVFADTQMEI